MFLVTNRKILRKSGDCSILGSSPNVKGPNELRLVEATKRGARWRLEVLPDEVDATMRDAVGANDRHIVSYVTRKLLARVNPRLLNPKARARGRNLLVFVHGYNNDVENMLERSLRLSKNYGVEVLPFSWPANGGGVVSGTASYKSDKRDAKASIGALDRILHTLGVKLKEVTEAAAKHVQAEACRKFPDNLEQRRDFVAYELEDGCPFTVNLMAHSMGNYLYKHLLLSTASEGRGMVFDNVVLVAADTNNKDHARWVDEIRARRRIYVTINEDDRALQTSRMKSGEEQRARLGHYPFDLDSKYAAYLQFTGASNVGSSHAYFEGKAIENPAVRRIFKRLLNGGRPDGMLEYEAASNTYRVRERT